MIMFENALRLFFYPNKGKEFQLEPPLGGEWNGIEKRVLAGFVVRGRHLGLDGEILLFPQPAVTELSSLDAGAC